MINDIQDLVSGLRIGEWHLHRELGRGGNGVVWEATSIDGASSVAIKFLRKKKPVALRRFMDEVTVVRRLEGVLGILPVLAADLSDTTQLPWFAMPLATRLDAALKGRSLSEIVEQFATLAGTLATLHARKISHRDVKPANLLSFQGQAVLSDFGIARFPGYGEVTQARNVVGPGPTMAPELRRGNPPKDVYPADVFSLAKSLWMILAGQSEGFEGEYSLSQRRVLDRAWPEEHLRPLHQILGHATSHEPANRPSASALARELTEWVDVISDIDRRAPDEWRAVELDLFPHGVPSASEWSDLDSIRSVLDRIGRSRIASHVMLPGGGGHDIRGASVGRFPETLELDFGTQSPIVVYPDRLYFRRIDGDRANDFFLLKANRINLPAEFNLHSGSSFSDFTELSLGRLTALAVDERSEWGGKELPEGSSRLTICHGGSFLLVMRTSSYNRSSGTYDGRHINFSPDDLAKAFAGGLASKSSEIGLSAVYVEEDLAWQHDRSLRPALKHVAPQDVVRLIRKWPRHRCRSELGMEWGIAAVETLLQASEEHQAIDAAISELLQPFSDEALLEIVAIMYVGRDAGDYPQSLRRWEISTRHHLRNRGEYLRVLAEKVEASRYLARGLRAIGAYRLKL